MKAQTFDLGTSYPVRPSSAPIILARILRAQNETNRLLAEIGSLLESLAAVVPKEETPR